MTSNSPPSPAPAPTRIERDSFGPIQVPATALWGAQTARSVRFFAIGGTAVGTGLTTSTSL